MASPSGKNIETDAGYVGSDQNLDLNFSGNSATLMLPFKRKDKMVEAVDAVVLESVRQIREKTFSAKTENKSFKEKNFRPISVWNTNFYD